jgi:hypothetical protein
MRQGRPPNTTRRRDGNRARPLLETLEDRLAPTAKLTLPTITTDAGGGTVSVPISINQLQDNAFPTNHVGLKSFQLAITYPTGVFDWADLGGRPSSLSQGSVLMSDFLGDWVMSANVPADGQLDITVSSQGSPITSDSPAAGGSLVIVNFPISGFYYPARTTTEAIKVVSANGSFQTAINGYNGTYVLSPAPPYSGAVVLNPAVAILTQGLGNWTANTPGYNQELLATGGTGSRTWTLSSGSLPPGLTLGSAGTLTGTPTTAGTYTFFLTASDRLGQGTYQSSDPLTTLQVNGNNTTPRGISGNTIAGDIYNSPGFHGFSLNNSGLTIFDDPAGVYGTTEPSGISGNLIVGTYQDSAGSTHGFVYDGSAFTSLDYPGSSYTSVTGISGSTIVGSFAFSTAGPWYNFEYDGTTWTPLYSLPAGDSVQGVSGNIVVGQQANYSGSVFLYDGSTYILPPGFPSSAVVLGISGSIIFGRYTDTANTYKGYFYNDSTDTFTTVDATAEISGISDTNNNDFVGLYWDGSNWQDIAYFAGGGSSIRAFTIVINPPLTMAASPMPSWTAGLTGYSQTYVTGGTGNYTTIQSGSLPPGVYFTTNSAIGGTPTVPGTYNFTLTVSDRLNANDTFTPLNDPAATMGTYAMGVYGNSVVGSYEDANGIHGFFYNGSTYTTLDDPAADLGSTYAMGMSNNNIVGYYDDAAGEHGFIYNYITSTYTTLDDPMATPGTTQALAISVNDIVGLYNGSDGASHGFLYDGSTWTTIDDPLSSPSINYHTTPSAVSDGTIVGSYSTFGTGSHGFVDTFGTYTTLDDTNSLPGNTWLSGAWITETINDYFDGSVVGIYSDGTYDHGLYYSPAAGFSSLDDPAALPGTTRPTGVYFNSIVGYYQDSTGTHGFLATRPGDTGTRTFSVVINAPVSITTPSLASGTFAVPYSQTLGAAGGTGTLTFSAAGLPPGLTLNSNGVLTGTPTAGGTFTVTVTATDSLGATGSKTYTLVIGPAQWIVSVVGSVTVQAGTSFQVMVQAVDSSGNPVSNYLGPGTATTTISPSSPGSYLPPTFAINSSGVGFFQPNLQQAGTFTIMAQNSAYLGSTTVMVTAGTPAKLAFAAQPANTVTGVPLAPVTVQILDLFGNVVTSDNSDQVTLGISSGPGSFSSVSTTTATVSGGVATFSDLTLATPGSYTLSAIVPGLYTGHPSTAFSVAPLQIVPGSFVGTPSGFTLQFNAPYLVNSLTPVLYGRGFGAAAPPPSVILTTDPGNLNDTAAYVEGSLILDQASNRITFLATNTAYQVNTSSPLLPDGTYTAIVRSSAATDGFQALNPGGGFLDGLNTSIAGSGDFRAVFTVNAAATKQPVVWVPATADGPGQPLNAPGNNQVGGGYPVYLDSSGGVTSVLVTVNYNPALLTISGATGAGFTLLGTSTAGQANLQYSGPALAAGTQTPIGFLTASVPAGTTATPTPYRAKDLLHLSGISVNGAAIASGGDALHLVAYVGDADGNGSYSSNDAVLITRAALQTDSGFTAYSLVDPVIVADTDGSGFIPADAALQVNEAGVGFPTNNLPTPPIPPGVHFQATGSSTSPARQPALQRAPTPSPQATSVLQQLPDDTVIAVEEDLPRLHALRRRLH